LNETRSHRIVDWLIIALAGCLALALFQAREWTRTGGQVGVPLDDAWIHYRFADNLIHGYGFSYNPGEPTPGSTAPLWTLLLAGARLVTGEFLITSKALSALGLLGSGWALYEYAQRRTARRWLALAAGILTVWAGRLVWAGMSGMETSLFILLSILAVDCHEFDLATGRTRPLTAVFFGLASQARPEGHLLFCLSLTDNLWSALGRSKWEQGAVGRLGRQMLGSTAIYLLINAPYALFAYATTRHLLANTFLAKATPGFAFSPRLLQEYMRFVLWEDNPVLGLLLPVGWMVWTVKALKFHRRNDSGFLSLLVPAWAALLPLLTAFVTEHLWHNGRYLMPVIPFNLFLALVGLNWLADWTKRRWAKGITLRTIKIMPRLIWPASLILILAASTCGAMQWADRFAWNVDNVNDMQVALGHWAAEHTPSSAVLALNDVGAIGYISQRQVLDVVGLVSPETIDALRGKAPGWEQDVALCRFLSYQQPEYAILFPNWYPELTRNRQVLLPIHAVRLENNTIAGGEEMVVYQARWPYVTAPSVVHRLEAGLGGLVRLRGFDLSPEGEIAPGGEVRLTLYWESLAAMETDYKAFVHLVDKAEHIRGQHDGHPVGALAPTSFWQPGDVVRDEHILAVAPDAPPGEYRLLVGLYDEATTTRLPVESGPEAGGDRVLLTHVKVSR